VSRYAEPADILDRKDWRDIGDLCSDDSSQVAVSDLLVDPKLLAALDDASGEIEAALVVGGRYTVSQLEGLTGTSLAHLKRITCELAMYHLLARRPKLSPDQYEMHSKLRDTYLEQLRTGVNVFALAANIDAGTVHVDGPSVVQIIDLNLMRDQTLHYYPARRMPGSR